MEVGEDGVLLVGYPRFVRVFPVVDVEAVEEGVVEQTADIRAGVAVEDVRVGDEVECVLEDADADGECLGGVHQTRLQSLSLVLELDELHPDLRLRHRAVGEEIDQPVLLLVQVLQLPVETSMRVAGDVVLVGDDLFQQFSGLGREGRRELEGAVVLYDRVFDQFDREAGQVA
ncbi:hypothetical protein VMT40_32395 [Nocardia sp. CDC160]|nr:hypothetical protein [Nocardia sp. CDC160]MEC3919334.1 hypothetical protein [Nocardia sp. CDC160]